MRETVIIDFSSFTSQVTNMFTESLEEFHVDDIDNKFENYRKTLEVMRRYDVPEPYEKLKELTRGKAVNKESIRVFIEGLDIPEEAKTNLLKLTPDTYIGAAVELARTVENVVVNIVNRSNIQNIQ
ncbi:hypothetical protein V8G54_036448 [Vigna mungo]|uniref:Adenylosuccinate lyase PurB C-terminal domain-containing protein n=1 Tax=Vigna mungo TaxID=3915 RepID=A0AAQ3MH72_VIGMU